MESLDSIGIKHQTDKASQFSRTYAKPHDYMRHLERFFEPLRHSPLRMIEIGVGGGESIRTWLEYFQNADIWGVDINHSTNEWNNPKSSPDERYTFVHGDQSNAVFWKSFINVHGGDWDIVCDDGSHIAEPTVLTFDSLWPHLKHEGIYEIEDLNVQENTKVWLNAQVLNMHLHSGHEIDSIYFARELAILRKR